MLPEENSWVLGPIAIADTREKNHQIELEKSFPDTDFFLPSFIRNWWDGMGWDGIVITMCNVATQKGM